MKTNVNFSKLSQKAILTYNNIFASAKEEFSSKGYVNATIQSIAKNAKVSVGCVYKYFNNKDELYHFVIANEQKSIRLALNEAIKNLPTREEKELAGLKTWLYYVRDNPGIYKLIWEALFIDMEVFSSYYSTFSASYSKALKRDADQLRADDLDTISYILIGISNFLGVKMLVDKNTSDEQIDSMAKTAIKVLKNGFLK